MYRRKFSDAEALERAKQRRQERLAAGTAEEATISDFLGQHGIKHEREWIWMNGDTPIFADIFIPSLNLVLEIDGAYHAERGQKIYDHGRSMWLAKKFSVKTVRFWNAQVLSGQAQERIKQMLGL